MDDTQIRRGIADIDERLNNPWLIETHTVFEDERVELKREQLALWIETYGAAE